MPRNARNFWVTGEAEGMASRLGFGPRSKGGGFVVEVFQRENGGGANTPVLTVTGRVDDAGRLVLSVDAADPETGQLIPAYTRTTYRDAAGVEEKFWGTEA